MWTAIVTSVKRPLIPAVNVWELDPKREPARRARHSGAIDTEDWSICAPGVADCAVAVNAIAAAAAQSNAGTRFEFLMLFVPPETDEPQDCGAGELIGSRRRHLSGAAA